MTYDEFRLFLGRLRWRLWEKQLARCPLCAPMDAEEWEAMCDCFLPKYSGNWRTLVTKASSRGRIDA